jgi:DNA invertase Pin-like site-specific DNA recombinase
MPKVSKHLNSPAGSEPTNSAPAGRVFGYARVSTSEQSTNGQSLATQQRQLAGWAQMQDLRLDRVVIETISGGVEFARRSEGGKLLAELRRGDVLAVTKLDRFSRNLFDCLGVSEMLQEQGVSLYLLDVNPSDPVTGNGMSKLFMSMLGAFSEFERSRIGERIREIKQQQKARGEFTGGPPPFGFRHDEHKNLVPVPEQQAAIRQMRRLKAKGLSLRAIAAQIADSGIRISHVGVLRALSENQAVRGTAHSDRPPTAYDVDRKPAPDDARQVADPPDQTPPGQRPDAGGDHRRADCRACASQSGRGQKRATGNTAMSARWDTDVMDRE